MTYSDWCIAHPLSEYQQEGWPSVPRMATFDGSLYAEWWAAYEDARHMAWIKAEGREDLIEQQKWNEADERAAAKIRMARRNDPYFQTNE